MINLDAPYWWTQVPVLTGSSVELREVEARDAAALFELLRDPRVSQFISPPPPSVAAFEGFIAWAQRERAEGKLVCFAVVPRGLKQAIGLFQLRAFEPTFRTAEWGFAMGAAFWSTGLFQEAAVMVLEFAFETIGVHRLEARAVMENGRGNRVLQKLGAQGEAVLRKAFRRKSEQFLWAIVAEEWKAPEVAPPSLFDAARTKREIARAVAQQPAAVPIRKRTSGSPEPFPFFLTESVDEPPKEH